MAGEVPKGPNEELPVINDWRTKSFWLIVIIPGALVISNMVGFNLLEFFNVTTDAELADKVYMVVTLIMGIAGLVARAAPQARLKFMGALAGADSSTARTVQSPWVVGVSLLVAMVIAGCSGSQFIEDKTGITKAQQECVQPYAIAFFKENAELLKEADWKERVAVVNAATDYVIAPEQCNIDSAKLAMVRSLVDTALTTFLD